MSKKSALAKAALDTLAEVRAGDEPSQPANAVRNHLQDRTTLLHGEIVPDPNQPRRDFDAEALLELAASIEQDGLLENLVVLPPGPDGLHTLIAGERRWRAIGQLIAEHRCPADLRSGIPVLIKDVDAAAAARLALIENLQRKDLKPLEEARAFKRLIDDFGMDKKIIADAVRFTVRFVEQRLQLLQLKPGDMLMLEQGQITIEDARRRIAAYPVPLTTTARLALAELVDLEPTFNQSTRILTSIAAEERDDAGRTRMSAPALTTPELQDLQQLRDRWLLGYLRVEFLVGGETTGRCTVEWAWNSKENIKAELPGVLGKARAAVIAELRAEAAAGGMADPGDGGPWTPWLRNIPEIDPAIAERAAQARAAQEKANAERDATWKQQREAQEAKAKALKDTDAKLLQAARTFVTLTPAYVQQLLAERKSPLPWRMEEDSSGDVYLLDADGAEVDLDTWDSGDGLRGLLMAAMNASAGLEPVFVRPEPLERDAFEAAMVAAVLEDFDTDPAALPATVTRLLDAYLVERKIAFGDDANVWTANAAAQLAVDLWDDADLSSEALAEEEDLEAAPAEDDPIPDHLKKLAGIPAGEPVEA